MLSDVTPLVYWQWVDELEGSPQQIDRPLVARDRPEAWVAAVMLSQKPEQLQEP